MQTRVRLILDGHTCCSTVSSYPHSIFLINIIRAIIIPIIPNFYEIPVLMKVNQVFLSLPIILCTDSQDQNINLSHKCTSAEGVCCRLQIP
jgi:hypothetical protein